MKKEELIVGEIYCYSTPSSNNPTHIFIYDGLNIYNTCKSKNWICITGTILNKESNNFCTLKGVSEASQEKKNWLNACINANKFIPFDEVNQSINYEIY